MQPDGQSPQPTVTATRNAPTPDAGATSYQLDWPIMSESLGMIPSSLGSWAMTAATASSAVVTGPPPADGTGLAVGAAAPLQATSTHIASSIARMPRLTMAPGRDRRG